MSGNQGRNPFIDRFLLPVLVAVFAGLILLYVEYGSDLPGKVFPGEPTGISETDCWATIWTFDPISAESIASSLNPPRSGYSASYDPSGPADGPGSLRVETSKDVADYLRDPNAWSWMMNLQTIKAQDGRYRLVGWIKTENASQSHISVVGRDAANRDVYKSGSDQIVRIPIVVDNGTFDWDRHYSLEFNPKDWDPSVAVLVVGLNAGWSPDGQPAITWFGKVELQYCRE